MEQAMQEALSLVEEHEDIADFVGPRSEDLVLAAEAVVGTQFPPSYREFLLKLGMGEFGLAEFAGIVDDNFMAAWPDAVGLYVESVQNGMPPQYFPVDNWGDGTVSALDLARRSSDGECPVVSCHDSLFRWAAVVDEAPTFGDYFLTRLREQL